MWAGGEGIWNICTFCGHTSIHCYWHALYYSDCFNIFISCSINSVLLLRLSQEFCSCVKTIHWNLCVHQPLYATLEPQPAAPFKKEGEAVEEKFLSCAWLVLEWKLGNGLHLHGQMPSTYIFPTTYGNNGPAWSFSRNKKATGCSLHICICSDGSLSVFASQLCCHVFCCPGYCFTPSWIRTTNSMASDTATLKVYLTLIFSTLIYFPTQHPTCSYLIQILWFSGMEPDRIWTAEPHKILLP